MIRCQLIRVTRNRRGQALREIHVVQGESLQIGRAAESTIHLPDPRVNLHQARIVRGIDGHYYVESEQATIFVRGAFERRARISEGVPFVIGPCEFLPECAPDKFDLALAMEWTSPLPDDRDVLAARSRTTLVAAGMSQRRIALALLLLIVLAFIVMPLLPSRAPVMRDTSLSMAVGMDQSWNPGPLAPGHAGFQNDCKACHQKPFIQVEDAACLACHKDMPEHVVGRPVAEHDLATQRCASCHRDHKGPGLAQRNSGLCVDCHRKEPSQADGIARVPISDFTNAHPQFRYQVRVASGDLDRQAVFPPSTVREHSGLVFAHDVHLARAGVSSPAGNVQLECSNCHVPEPTGIGFKPITLNGQCADCHRLEFDPDTPDRRLPHAAPAEVLTALQEFYAGKALAAAGLSVQVTDGLQRRPGAQVEETRRLEALTWAQMKAQAVAKDVIEVRICSTCHTVGLNAESATAWQITPVLLNHAWLPHARFSHAAHDTAACTDCHNATLSKDSADVLMPDIATCRTCHAGTTPEHGKVPSTCSSCHGFHGMGFAGMTNTVTRTLATEISESSP